MDGYAHVIDAVAENGTAYLISEHIDGCSLEDMLLSRGGRISFGEALEMMKPIFSAVDIINGQGITHCAIAPDSIRVTNMGKLKLTGCGEAARFACASESAAGTDGKSAYRPREYFNRGEAVNASTDVYGLAATIYRMITGRAPRRQSGGEIAAPSRLGVRMMKNAENALMNADVLAAEGCTVLFLHMRKLLDSCGTSCGFHGILIKNLLRETAEKNIRITERMTVTSRRTTREKLIAYLSAEAARQVTDLMQQTKPIAI